MKITQAAGSHVVVYATHDHYLDARKFPYNLTEIELVRNGQRYHHEFQRNEDAPQRITLLMRAKFIPELADRLTPSLPF